MLPHCDRLRRVSRSSALEAAPGGAAALAAFPKGPKNLYITDFRAAVKDELELEAPFV